MHGSIIWYENAKTKECVKIPVRAFSDDGKPVRLKLIYGEDVKPLLIYPAQKAEYIEPLTDLQLMFKDRLFNKDTTRFVVIVGYSFRDKYIVHMLWDAARVNEKLHIILISPNANEIFEQNLKYIDKDSLSRIHDRVICLPYPFSTVIYELKNHYLQNLLDLRKKEEENIFGEKSGRYADWQPALRNAIDCEFLTKAESIIEKLEKDWGESDMSGYSEQAWLHYAIKGLLSSIAMSDGNENNWIKRVNKSLKHFSAENLHIANIGLSGVIVVIRYQHDRYGQVDCGFNALKNSWLAPVFSEIDHKIRLLGPLYETKLEKIKGNFDTLKKFENHMSSLNGTLSWDKYLKARKKDKSISEFESILSNAPQWEKIGEEIARMTIEIERRAFTEAIGNSKVQFKPL